MQPGDTLHIRGAHDGFDGTYFEAVWLAPTPPGGVQGKPLACTSTAPCVIQGYGTEVPTIRGMTRRSDWQDMGGGVYRRTMEASPTTHGQIGLHQRDNFDPMILVDRDQSVAYDGDNVATPRDGRWSYFPATHEIAVNPAGAASAADVMVPHHGDHVTMRSPTAYLTLRGMRFEGSRGTNFAIGKPPDNMAGIRLEWLVIRHSARYFVLSNGAPGLVIEDTLAEHGMRGYSWAAASNDGHFGFRLFHAHGGAIRRSTVRHIGSAGACRFSCTGTGEPSCPTGCANYWRCPHCDSPWNDPSHTKNSASGEAIQAKQTEGFTFEDNVVEDIATAAYTSDVSRGVTMRRNTARRVTQCYNARNQTPDASGHTRHCDTLIDRNVCEDSGGLVTRYQSGCGDAGVTISDSSLEGACTFVAGVTNNTIVRPTCEAISAPDSPLVTVAGNSVVSGGNTTTTLASTTTTTSTTATVPTTTTQATTTSTTSTTSRPPTTSTTTSTSTTSTTRPTTSSTSTSTTSTTRPTTSSTSTSTTSSTTQPTTSSTSTSTTSTTRPTTSSTSTSTSSSTSTSVVTTTTLVFPACGNGVLDAGEECDDGNTEALDGCDGLCLIEEIASTPSGTVLSTEMDPPQDPIAANIVSPRAAGLIIVETSSTVQPPARVSFIGRQVHSEARHRLRTIKPLVLTFTLDDMLFPNPDDPFGLKVFRDGRLIGRCLGRRRAFPDPCVSSAVLDDHSDLKMTLLTTVGGEWNFGSMVTHPGTQSTDRCLGGTKLLLQDKPGRPGRRRLLLQSHDTPQLIVGDTTDIEVAIAEGGSFHVMAIGGDGFAATYLLPPEGWRLLDPKNPDRGVRYRDADGPIKAVVFRTNESLEVAGAGALLEQSLGSEPEVVQIELRLGQYGYRFEFGGEPREFKANRKLLRRWADRSPTCLAELPPDGSIAP